MRARDELGKIVNGVFDVVYAFALALDAKGIISRAEIGGILRQVVAAAERQEGGPTARTALAELTQKAFDAPLAGAQARAQLRLVEGDEETA